MEAKCSTRVIWKTKVGDGRAGTLHHPTGPPPEVGLGSRSQGHPRGVRRRRYALASWFMGSSIMSRSRL